MAKTSEHRQWTVIHGRRLHEKRVSRGLTQKEAALELRVTDDTVRHWENGETRPRDENVAALAQFCGVTVDELFTPLGVPATLPPIAARDPESALNRVRSWRRLRILGSAGALVVIAFVAAYVLTVRRNRFVDLRPTSDGVQAIDRSGRTLWRLHVSPDVANAWALARTPGRRKPLIAGVMSPPRDYRLEAIQNLTFAEPDTKTFRVVEKVRLPTVAQFFPSYARRYSVSAVTALDLDGDDIDEVLVTYEQVPECPSYTVLYEPRFGRGRVVFAQTGAHNFVGAYDVDRDGRRDLLFLGINNGFNWINALAAVRVEPWVDNRSAGDDLPLFSPDHRSYLDNDRALLFYALLPRGGVPNNPDAVSWQPQSGLVTVRLLNGRVAILTARGFPAGILSAVPETVRESLRRDAYRHNRECRRLGLAQRDRESLEECDLAVKAAERAGDPILLEAMQRDLGKTLIAAGHPKDGEALLRKIAAASENASEIYYDAAIAFHLRGDLLRAIAFYELGMGRGGSPESGKSKHEFIQGEVLALVEMGAWRDAYDAIERFHARYVAQRPDSTSKYREFVRWRSGEVPRPETIDVPHNATDLLRYWILEFRAARGDDDGVLLESAEALLAESNQPTGPLLSLRAVLLSRTGRGKEAAAVVREAIEVGRNEARMSIIARAHLPLIQARHRLLSE